MFTKLHIGGEGDYVCHFERLRPDNCWGNDCKILFFICIYFLLSLQQKSLWILVPSWDNWFIRHKSQIDGKCVSIQKRFTRFKWDIWSHKYACFGICMKKLEWSWIKGKEKKAYNKRKVYKCKGFSGSRRNCICLLNLDDILPLSQACWVKKT